MFKRLFLVILAILSLQQIGFGQWGLNGNFLIPGEFLGSTNNESLRFRQNNIERARFVNGTFAGYNGQGAINNVNRIHLGLNGNFQNPFSMIHMGTILNSNLARQWMNVGTTMGAGADIFHVGILQRPAGTSNSNIVDAVLAWGCNDDFFSPGNGPDNLRFLFLAPTNELASPGSAPEGLETMRITPNGNIGIGNSFNNDQQPSRRLVVHEEGDEPQFRVSHTLSQNATAQAHADFQVSAAGDLYIKPVLDGVKGVAIGFLEGEGSAPAAPFGIQTVLDIGGLTRIRNLRSQGDNDCIVIGSNAQGAADNYLKRLDFTGNSNDFLAGDGTWQQGGGEDCRWKNGTDPFTINETMFMGVDPNSDCYRGKLLVGTTTTDAKIEVENRTARDRVSTGIDVAVLNDTPNWMALDNDDRLIGISSLVSNTDGATSNTNHIGIESVATFGGVAVGVDALANRGVKNTIGVYSKAVNGSLGTNIAYYGEVDNPNDVILYQVGGTSLQTGPTINISDESVKTNIAKLEGASTMLNDLEVKTYNYSSPEGRYIAFQDGMQYGLIAQQVAEVIPAIVHETTIPEARDSSGNFIEGSSVDLLGISYESLIPILVAGFQEQNDRLELQLQANQALEEQVSSLQEQLQEQAAAMTALQEQMGEVLTAVQLSQSKMNDCCGTLPQEKGHSSSGKVELEQNFPNPFETETAINFTISEAAQIRLEISDNQGRVLEVLVNQKLNKGEYTERWDASAHAPGTYYYSLYADTALLTKKMIKR